MEEEEASDITEKQRIRAETNRLAALAKRRAAAGSTADSPFPTDPWKLFKCRKLSAGGAGKAPPADGFLNRPGCLPESSKPECQLTDRFRIRLEICSPDSFSAAPEPVKGFAFPGEEECLWRLGDYLANVMPTHYTQSLVGGKAGVYKLRDYDAVLRCLRTVKTVDYEEIPWGTYNVIEKLSHSFVEGRWIPCRPEHLPSEMVNELIGTLPKKIVDALMPFQLDGVRFGLQRGGRCLIADEMGLGKTLQAIAIASCFMNEGSLLVVCPAILRFSWAEELERWFPCLPTDIHLVFCHRDNPLHLKKWPKIVVISYTMLHRLRNSMLEHDWGCLIVDESHHLRCSKKASEPEEIRAVLDVVMKVKRIVLLSGTPSLSRPGLLGKNKFDFAKTYCDLQFGHDSQGKVFKDFSKGVRLEELNVLLRQTVMIRRLKQHVLSNLPPKRRQIIRLLLKKSDVASAKAALRVCSANESIDETATDMSLEKLDQSNGNDGHDKLRDLSYQEIGIAKLSGFYEWLSLHPLVAMSDDTLDSDMNLNSHKMIIFAHHHKVLDRIQEFICEKGIPFVRIDGNTLPKDRQSAVLSFQSSSEVKIAVIGITAGGVGLNLSSAKTVVFLELPPSSSWMLQDTTDDLHWQHLNRSLYRVSSTTNGKRDAIREIVVEDVSFLESSDKIDGNYIQMLEKIAILEPSVEPTKCSDTNLGDSIQHSELHKRSTPQGNDCNEASCHTEQTENCEIKSNKALTTDVSDGDPCDPVKANEDYFNLVNSLRFEGTDSRPRPLFQSFRPEELNLQESPLPTDHEDSEDLITRKNAAFRQVLVSFLSQWHNLRPIHRKKLLGKPLQLPLAIELCYLNEGANHDTEGVLKGKSKRRTTPLFEISHPLPENAEWKKIHLLSSNDKKAKEYMQGWTLTDDPLCKLCQQPCRGRNARAPEFFEDLFCNLACYEEYRLRTNRRFIRQELFQIEHGVCTNCQLDCHKLVKCLKPLSMERRREYIKMEAPQLAHRKKLLEKLVNNPNEGNAWHADHILPVYRGGGECLLENMRTLCVACHYDVTAAQCAERRTERVKAQRQLKAILKGLKNDKHTGVPKAKPEDPMDAEAAPKAVDDELMVQVPGSAYSMANKPALRSEDAP
ncbi:hypothetical protein CDL15_Pgr008839 [Punica granatum]|uniref:DNA annealing helicase and endonuclease ZRANB3 n=1 Tax=Punica granatum TaxID=22663 RepID=A0A218VY92_PUNGR|nr:hypothetical protein CDL15_Pgr008839 [Punica granatum]